MPKLSAVALGVNFENRALNVLRSHFSMSLQRVGGRSDGGIDLIGWWWLPLKNAIHRERIRVIGQCKAEKMKTPPKHIREMEGVMQRYTSRLDTIPTVALFVTESQVSKESLNRVFSSKIPFFILHLPKFSASAPEIGSVIWNPALGAADGLLAGKAEARWEHSTRGPKTERMGLWFNEQKLENWSPENDDMHPVPRLADAMLKD